MPDPTVHFVYLGRRGALSWLALELAQLLVRRSDLRATMSISTSNELVRQFLPLAPLVTPFSTFTHPIGVLTGLPRFLRDGSRLVTRLRGEHCRAIVVLMPHVWTPLLGILARRAGLHYGIVLHDAVQHPGDRTALLHSWLERDAYIADTVFTLSSNVASRLMIDKGVAESKIRTLAHPVLSYGARPAQRPRHPPRVLFFGRIMAYKRLELLIEAVELLRRDGIQIGLGIVGEGPIGNFVARLAALDAEIINQWVDHGEIGMILSRYDIIALPYIEASQSGVIAAAIGAGLPLVVTPVAGLVEQVATLGVGVIAAAVTPAAFGEALRRLITDRELYASEQRKIERAKEVFSIASFAEHLLSIVETRVR